MAREEGWSSARRRVSRRSLVAGGATAAFLAACGGSKDEPTASTSIERATVAPPSGGAITTGTAAPAAAMTAVPGRRGGTFRFSINADPPSLNLWQEFTFVVPGSMAPMYNQLVQLNPLDEDQVIPDLAKSWEYTNNDKTEIVFRLQDGPVTWHDGKPFTAEDVKVTYDWLRSPPQGVPSPRTTAARGIDKVEVVDEKTVRFRLKGPSASFLSLISNHHYAMGAKHIVTETNTLLDSQQRPVGTGPFVFKNYRRNNVIDVERNARYWRRDRPYLDALACFVIVEDATTLTNFLAGQLHLIGVPSADIPRVKQELGSKGQVLSWPSLSRVALIPNGTRPPFNDVRMREALSAAVDRDEFNTIIQQGIGFKGSYNTPKGFYALPAAELAKFTGYGGKADLTKAKQLMTAAGYPNGFKGVMPARQDFEQNAITVQAMLKQAGFDMEVQIERSAKLTDRAIATDFDVLCHTWATPTADPDDSFGEMIIHPDRAGRNWSKVITPEVDRLFDLQRVEFDLEKRKKLVNDCDRAALGNYPNIVIMYTSSTYAWYNTVNNYRPHTSVFTNHRREDVWLSA